jgi:hypothetical protein
MFGDEDSDWTQQHKPVRVTSALYLHCEKSLIGRPVPLYIKHKHVISSHDVAIPTI